MHHFSRKNAPSPSRSLNSNYNQQCDEKVGPHQLVHFCRNGILPALMDIKEQKLKVSQNKPPLEWQTDRKIHKPNRETEDRYKNRKTETDRKIHGQTGGQSDSQTDRYTHKETKGTKGQIDRQDTALRNLQLNGAVTYQHTGLVNSVIQRDKKNCDRGQL